MTPKIDLKKADIDPSSAFPTPRSVLEHPRLNRQEKIELLRRWEYDARLLEVAEEENMSGGGESVLREILLALAALGAGRARGAAGPEKQSG